MLKPTADEIAAFRYYTGLGYLRINARLRGDAQPDAQLEGAIERLDSALEKSTLKSDMVVFRGFPRWYSEYMRRTGIAVGSILYDDAFLSTSTSEEVSKAFAEWPDGLLIRIVIPKGSKAMDLSPYSTKPDEKEILLPRGTGLRIVRYDRQAKVLDAEVV